MNRTLDYHESDGATRSIVSLFVGDADHHLFAEAVAWLKSRYELSLATTIDDACQVCEQRSPQFIVIAQSRPGQFTSAAIERLHRMNPVSRLIGLLGGWCEGETRTGAPWPGVTRVYWHQFCARAEHELAMSSASTWFLPRTVTSVESQLALATTAPWVSSGEFAKGLVVLRTSSRLSFDSFSEPLLADGYATSRIENERIIQATGVIAGLWDCRANVSDDHFAISRFVRQLAPAPVLLMAGFPRATDLRRAADCGATGVLGKPFMNDDLLIVLRNAIRLAPTSTRLAPLRDSA